MILPDPPAPALAPPSEDDAFAALQNLEYLAAYGTAPPDEPTRLAVEALKFRQPTDRAALEAYATHRRARALPLFPTQTAKASRERDTFLANLYTKAPEEFLPKADLDNLNAAAEASGDPENFKKGQLNRTFLSAITGKQLSGEAYALTRDLYARQHLGMTGPVTDAAFHGAMAARHTEDAAAGKAALAASSAAFAQALVGEPIDRAATAAAIAALPERHRPTARESIHAATRDAHEARRRNLPAVSHIAATVESIVATPGDPVTGATRETRLRQLVVDMAAALPDDQAEREIALAMLGKELSKLPEDDRIGLTRVWDGIQRGLNNIVEKTGSIGWEAIASAAGVAEYVPDKVVRRPGFGQETINDRTKVAQLKGLIQGDALDLRKASDSFLLKASIAAAPSVPYTFLAISPYGFGVMAASMAGQSVQDARIASPETNANARLSAAIASGVGQAAIETIFTRAALKLATGRIPTLTNLLNRAAIGSLTARGAAGALGAGAAAYGIEFTEEVAQDALDLSLQNAATELSGINANVDWRQFFTDWTPGGGAKADETLLAITPFALIAGGIAGVHQFRNGAYYLKNAALMRAAGITEPQIRSITGAASPEEAQDLLKTSFEEAQQRQAADPKERERLATYREAALADLRASNEALTRAGLPRIAQEWNDTTEEYQTVFLNPADDSRQIFDTEEEALEAWHAEINTQNEADLDALATAAEDGFIEHVMGEGQLAATGVSVQTVQREVSLASEQSAMLADVKAAREAGRRASTAAKRRAAEDALATATTRLANLKARVEIFILDQGLTPEAAADTLKNTFIRGRVTAQKIGDAIVGQTIELFNGRTLSDVVEEFSEANLRNGILDGVVDPEIMLDDIRRYETATGRQVIAKGYAYDPANPLPLTEGFSKLARGYVFSQIRGGQLPETVRKWAEMQALIGSAILSTGSAFAADINVAGDLREAMKAGHLPPRLQRKLADSAGISESDRNYRLQKAMEEQLAAEAMGGFPEIRETLRGRLPHPNTARKNNLPLVGELQRIYDSLIRPTRRKTKDGRTIDRTNEANAYFLPEGQVESLDLVRRSLNEKGFDFATPAEMLDALDASISYNKPQYGTFSGESFSLATGSTITQTPADYAARDTASHVSFSISPADLAHNARLRQPLGVLAAVADQYGNKPAADPILYRPGRFYRVIDEAALADFRASGILRPNPDPATASGRAYGRLFASEGAPSSRYRGRYIVEIDPARAGDWQANADASGYHSAAIGSITADSALRIYDTATRSTVIDNLGDEAFLPMAAGESYSVAINMPRTTQESRTIAGPAPVADLTAKPLRAFTQMFQSAPGEPGDLSPRGDGGTDTSFSLSRQQETYEQAKKNVSESSARLRDAQQANAADRAHWENQHGNTDVITDQVGAAYRRSAVGGWNGIYRKQYMGIFNESESDFIKSSLSAGYSHFASRSARSGMDTSERATKLIRNEEIVVQSPGYDHAPFVDRNELVAAREAMMEAEAALYLSAEEYDPDQAARIAAGESARRWKLEREAAAFAALLDARDTEAKNAAKSFVAKVWQAYAAHDEIFQFGRTDSKKAEDIAASVSAPGKPVTADDRGDAVSFRSSRGGITVNAADTANPYISASGAGSKGAKQGGGAQLYAAALDWIHNNEKTVRDDPAGLTAINAIRRTSNFLASAIRWGTTAHLKPHTAQNVGKWTRSDVLNTSLLATKEMENAFKAVPSAKGWRFDFRSGRFLDANATELTEKEIEDAVTAGDPDNSGIGFSTLQRAVITASAIEAFQRGETADTLEAAERFLPDSLTGISYSLSHRAILRLEEAIARKMTQGPEERAAYYEKLRNRLAATVLQLRETKRNLALGQTEAERERNRIRDGLAEARAIIAALPPDARGRVTFPIGDILDADTERGQVNALLRLIDEADSALEKVLLKEYQEAYETLLDLAKPDLRQNKTLRGRLTPEAQRLIALVQEAVVMDEATLAAQIVGAEAAIATIEAETPQTPDEIKDAQQRLIAASQWLHILTTHGALATLDAARTAAAYENLLGIYTTARTTRRILDEAKKAELMAARQEVIDSLPATDQAKHASRVNDDGRIDLIKSFGLSMVSFHQAMEWFFPKSATARKLQDQVRAADRAFTRAKIDARDRFAAFADAAWNITGKAKTWQRNRILADLSTARADWNVQLTEGIGTTEEKLTEAQADAILAGKMKTGWETDRIALISLQQALADFRLQRLKVQREQQEYAALTPEQKKHAKRVYPFSSTVIRFKRITSRGTPGPLLMSDLEVLYILQLWAQEEYQPALDKYGFTEAVVTTLQGKLNPKAEQLGDFLRTEYDAEWDRLNPVYRNRFGMDMPKIRNYAPGQFQHAQAQAGGTMTPAGAAPPVNAMAAGFTKARTHHLARPEKSNAMAAYWSHLEATEYFIAFSDILTDARTVFRTPEVRRRLESAYGTKATALFHQWLDALELDGNFKAADTLAQKTIVANLLNTQSAVGLAYNIGVLFKQAGATMGAMLEMKTTEALHGVAALARDPSGWTAVWNSEAIRQRVAAGMSPEDLQLLAASAESPSAILHALAIGRLPIAYADAVFTTAGAAVAYSHHRAAAAKEGLAPEQAHAHALAVASRIIERTAQPATPQDKSMAELSFGLLGRLLFMFKSDPRQKMAIVGMAAAQYARGDIKAPELFRKFFWGWFVYGIANELMTDAFQAITRDDDDPDRWSWKDYLAGGLAGPLNALPFYGTVFGYAASKILGTKGYSNSLNPLDRAAEDSIRLTRKIAEAFGDGKELTVQNYMTMSQQFAASLAILAGGLDSRLAILPASLRVLRDSWGVLLNTADAALPDSPETVAARIVAETEATEATASKENTRALNALANELAKLPTPARTARLASMDRDTREAVTRRLRKSLMTPSEQALANLSKASRAAAVAKILAALPESARERHLQRLKDLGLAP